jgi:hypothetical protein
MESSGNSASGPTSATALSRREKARAFQVEMAEKRKRAIELRSAGLSFDAIAQEMGISQGYASKLVAQGLNKIVRDPAQALIDREIRALEALESRLMKFLDAIHPLVQQGSVVTQPVLDETGMPVIDPRTGNEMRVPMHNVKTTLAVMAELRAVGDSRRKLLGIDKPLKVAATAPDGSNAPTMSQEQLTAALREGMRELVRPANQDVIDVQPVDK